MAYYAYKTVREILPDWVIAEQEDYQGDGNYDGDQWYAARDYIEYLMGCIQVLEPSFDFTKRIIKE